MQMKTHVEILSCDKVKYHADKFIKNFIDKIHSGRNRSVEETFRRYSTEKVFQTTNCIINIYRFFVPLCLIFLYMKYFSCS